MLLDGKLPNREGGQNGGASRLNPGKTLHPSKTLSPTFSFWEFWLALAEFVELQSQACTAKFVTQSRTFLYFVPPIEKQPKFLSTIPFIPSPSMSASLNKIASNSPSRQNPSELETSIAGALYDLETNTADLKVALRPLQFVSAREVR